jgi:hypothetical protein
MSGVGSLDGGRRRLVIHSEQVSTARRVTEAKRRCCELGALATG